MAVVLDKADLSLKYTAHFNDVKELLLNESAEVLNAPRKQALQDFVAQGIPNRKYENYKYSNMQPQFMPDFKFIHRKEEVSPDLEQAFRCDVPKLDTHLEIVVNGWFKRQHTKQWSSS